MASFSFMEIVKLTYRMVEYKLQQYSLKTSETIIVETDKGPIKGLKRLTVYGKCYYSFEKIPFAKPPLDELRFKAPVPADLWTEVIDCTHCCEKPLQEYVVFRKYKGSEDCLYLNVYTKNIKPEKLRPVMVWIYGGGFQIGEATRSMYGPDYLLEKDVLFVSITYRLGPFGFLSMKDPELDVPGNAGLKDQLLGLRWVKENISRFGGDPDNITLFGESAGGASTHLLMLTSQSKGLFHKAIIQSASALCPWTLSVHNNWAYRLAVLLGYSGEDRDKDVFQFLSKANGPSIVAITKRITNKEEKRNRVLFAFCPIVEPYITDHCILPKQPLEMMTTTWSNNIPMLIGGNSHEGLLFLREMRRRPVTLDEVKNCEYLVPLELNLARDSERCRELGLRIKKAYFGDKECSQETLYEYLELLSYKMFWHPISRTIKIRLENQTAPTYLYRFEYDSLHNKVRDLICGRGQTGACHGDELCYIFHNTFAREPPNGSPEHKTVERMIGMWTSFAEKSNPNCDAIQEIQFDPINKEDAIPKCLNISNDLTSIPLPEGEKLAIWDSLYEPSELYGKL